ncbi:MAG: hypothetical protein HZB38_08465 [Planctomycetes bacterium]|nr:hypothetical protein [Planctomycetota bacterium]
MSNRATSHGWRSLLRSWSGGLGFIAAAALPACSPPAAPNHFSVLTGVVKSCNRETGDLTVESVRRTRRAEATVAEYCVITKDTEIFINEQCAGLDRIQIGDEVELIGYREATPPNDRFVVVSARCNHPEPPASAPFSAPAVRLESP